MSMTSNSYRPPRYSSQMALIRAMASVERGVIPVTNSRSRKGPPPPSSVGGAPHSGGTSCGVSMALPFRCLTRPQLQADEDTFGVGEVADDPPHRLRELPHQGRDRHNLVAPCQLGAHQQVDDLDRVLA